MHPNGTVVAVAVNGDDREEILDRVRRCLEGVTLRALPNRLPALIEAGVPTDPDGPLAADVVDELLNEYAGEPDLAEIGVIAEAIAAALVKLPGKQYGWHALVHDRAAPMKREAFAYQYAGGQSKPAPDLIDGILVPGQTAVVAGREKTAKTTLAAAAAASLLTGRPFLGRQVRRAGGVVFLSRERPPSEVRRLVTAFVGKQVRPSRLIVTDDDSLVRTKRGRDDLRSYLRSLDGPGVVVLDPYYLLAGRGGNNDLAAAGDTLRRLVRPVVDEGATPVLVHHFTKASTAGQWPGLDDLNGAGIAAFARSWLLLARETEYAGGGVHALLCMTGTSRGDHGRLRVRVDERDMTVTARGDGESSESEATPAVLTVRRRGGQ